MIIKINNFLKQFTKFGYTNFIIITIYYAMTFLDFFFFLCLVIV